MSMASREAFEFNIEIPGLEDFVDDLTAIPKDLEANLDDALTEYGLLVEEGARELVHYDTGELQTSLEFQGLKRKGAVLEGSVGSELKYALRRHEEPYRMGTYDKYDKGAKFVRYYLNGRGRETLRKPNWRGMRPGRKFLERAVLATEQDFEDIMTDAYNKTLRGRKG